ncbi:MAG TPA: hypothetical protein EYG89_04465 [Bacteroidia bacterium]|nr:hypothetical protein [Bacteroidia bacterium]
MASREKLTPVNPVIFILSLFHVASPSKSLPSKTPSTTRNQSPEESRVVANISISQFIPATSIEAGVGPTAPLLFLEISLKFSSHKVTAKTVFENKNKLPKIIKIFLYII